MVKQRDRDEFAGVYEDHVWSVYGFIHYRVGSQVDAEDLTQETFERALKAWGRFDESRASVRTWLMAIARNLVIDSSRREGSRVEQPFTEELAAGRHDSAVSGDELELGVSVELANALTALGEREREIIALRYGGDLKGAEIAELTGLTLANVQQILSRSLRKLRDELSPARRTEDSEQPASPGGEGSDAGDANHGDGQ